MNPYAFDATLADFDEKVIAASHHTPVLVDFWAEWCNPCRTLKPLLEKLAAEYGGKFLLAKVDSDRNQALSARFGVRGIPNVKAFVGGKLVDEFTGALPEAQIRAFLERLIPSPAEPFRLAAREARSRGDADVARSLIDDALQADPASIAAKLDLAELHLDERNASAARLILDTMPHQAEQKARVEALSARLKLVEGGGNANPEELKARIDANPADLDARLRLANALALAQDYRPACEHLLDIIRRERQWQDQAARKALLDLFALLSAEPQHAALVREFRVALARTLN